jgi:hypothetical protein
MIRRPHASEDSLPWAVTTTIARAVIIKAGSGHTCQQRFVTHRLEDDHAIRSAQELRGATDERTPMLATPRSCDRRCRITAVLFVDRR